MATFNPFNLFKGNPKVQQLLSNPLTPLEDLLLQEPFIKEFKKSDNTNLEQYMNYNYYKQLVQYITIPQPDNTNHNKSIKFPFVSAEILSICNQDTFRYLLSEDLWDEQIVMEEIQVQKEIDSGSERSSIMSSRSNQSIKSNKSIEFKQGDKENIGISNEEIASEGGSSHEKSVCEDDFPDVHKKIIKVKQLVPKTVKKPQPPLLFQLLSYFKKDQFHILDGYICRTLENIINNRCDQFMKLLKKQNTIELFLETINHVDSLSVQEIILNIININCKGEEGKMKYGQEKMKIIRFVEEKCLNLQKVKIENENRYEDFVTHILSLFISIVDKIYSTISTTWKDPKTESLTKLINLPTPQLQIFSKIFTTNSMQAFVKQLQKYYQKLDQKQINKRIFTNILKILRIFIKTYILLKNKNLNQLNESDSEIIKIILEKCQESFDKVIKFSLEYILQNIAINQTDKPKNLLSTKITALECIKMLTQQNIFFAKNSLIDQPLFIHIFHLFEWYPKSSIIHNQTKGIIISLLKSQKSTLQKVLSKQQLIKFLYSTAVNEAQIKYQGSNKQRKCYIGHVTAICNEIKSINVPQSQIIVSFQASKEWQFIVDTIIDFQEEIKKQSIGGFQKIHGLKPKILFSKQQIKQHFSSFLQGIKFSNFDQFQNFEPENSDSQDQKQKPKRQSQVEQEINKELEGLEDQGKYFMETDV